MTLPNEAGVLLFEECAEVKVLWQVAGPICTLRRLSPSRSYFRPGDQLPTEDELLQRFQVSRITVRRVIQNLVSRGSLEICRGLETFVLSPRIGAELTKLTGFVEDMKSVGRRASARVVSQDVIAASARVAERLQLDWATRRAHETVRNQIVWHFFPRKKGAAKSGASLHVFKCKTKILLLTSWMPERKSNLGPS